MTSLFLFTRVSIYKTNYWASQVKSAVPIEMGVFLLSVFCFLLGGVLYLGCNAQQINVRSCSSVKDSLGVVLGSSGRVFDDFIEGILSVHANLLR